MVPGHVLDSVHSSPGFRVGEHVLSLEQGVDRLHWSRVPSQSQLHTTDNHLYHNWWVTTEYDWAMIKHWILNIVNVFVLEICTGVPLLVVLCNHIALSSTDVTPSSWWLVPDTLTFYTCVLCVLFLLTAFLFLFFQVFRTLRDFSSKKCEDTKKAISRR